MALINIKITDVQLTPQTVTVSGTFKISVTVENILHPIQEAAGGMLLDADGNVLEYVPQENWNLETAAGEMISAADNEKIIVISE
ncbi:hypothetical protein DWV84_23945 [Blautia sp. AF13-16]|uniref:hypothetical protein n=1 Tax=Blautia sp. AF13-16 TaxID=2292195 RepID=UPI000E4AFCB7|nr:hypothetical protein [Blautia sp. AF13-16]RHS11199.1 hypothetical protein DWV84_23945 [Blautia sp. AF13-16]